MWTDKQGRDWSTAVTVATVKRVKQTLDVLLTDVADADLIERLNADVILLCDVIYIVCEPQAKDRSVTDAQFGELLAGEVIDKAYESLMQDLLLFFQSGRRVAAAKKIMAAAKLEAAKTRLMEERLTEEQINQVIERELEKAGLRLDELTANSGSSPDSSE